MTDIDRMAARTGRQLKEDNTPINTAEMIEAIYNALVVDKDAGVDVTDRAGRSLGVVSAENIDIAISTLRDAITAAGAGAKTLADIVAAINVAYEAVLDLGTATGGSKTTLVDSTKDFETDILVGDVVKVTIGGIDYYRTAASNTADTITIAALPGAAATAQIGEAGTSEVTISAATEGVGGNEYTVEVVEAPGDDDNLSASLTGLVLTVYLGKAGGVLDNAKNTGTLVAGVIDNLAEFTAALTGSGGVVPVTVAPVEFTGGVAIVTVAPGSKYEIKIYHTV